MSTPQGLSELIDVLSDDIFDAYNNPRVYAAPEKENAVTAARYLARKLIRKGWRRSGNTDLPRCPYGTVTCFDPEPHRRCEM